MRSSGRPRTRGGCSSIIGRPASQRFTFSTLGKTPRRRSSWPAHRARAIHESVAPEPGEPVVVKHFPNSFRESRLLDELERAGAEGLTICGAMSHMCIDATTRAAADLGFNCLVAHDACATRDVEFEGKQVAAGDVHAAYMSALGFAYAKVMSTAML